MAILTDGSRYWVWTFHTNDNCPKYDISKFSGVIRRLGAVALAGNATKLEKNELFSEERTATTRTLLEKTQKESMSAAQADRHGFLTWTSFSLEFGFVIGLWMNLKLPGGELYNANLTALFFVQRQTKK